ncbi:MAG: DUF2157 domain-containing protein [Bacteroidia bacterium]
MHEKPIAQQLFNEQLISNESLQKVNSFYDARPFSLHTHLQTFLYLGVTLLATGLGILIYKNIDSIGHIALVSIIGLLCASCFTYCYLKKAAFSWQKTEAPNAWFDYILLLGALLLVTFTGYLQFEFKLFGEQWGLATFIPCIILFFAAYYFDHLGLLSMAIVLLGSWAGIAVAPLDLLKRNDFNSDRFIFTGIALGIFLAVVSYLTYTKNLKHHFYFTYLNFALHISFVAALCGLFWLDMEWLWGIIIALLFTAGYKYAFAQKSFYVLLFSMLYSYIALSYLVIEIGDDLVKDISLAYLLLIYFILSAIMLIKYLRQFKKELQTL